MVTEEMFKLYRRKAHYFPFDSTDVEHFVDGYTTGTKEVYEKLNELNKNIQILRTCPAYIDNKDLQLFAEDILTALQNIVKGE